MGNDVDFCEIAEICGKWLNYLTNGLNNRKMTYIFGKWLQYLRNGPVFEKRLNYVENDGEIYGN